MLDNYKGFYTEVIKFGLYRALERNHTWSLPLLEVSTDKSMDL